MNIKIPCVLVDIDGTIANNQHRWDRFNSGEITKDEVFSYEHAIQDAVVEPIHRLVKDLGMFNDIIVLTARHEGRDRQVTEDWLHKNRIEYDLLIMDPDNELSAAEFKVKEVEALKKDYDIYLALDDNPEVVAALRKAGVTTLQVGYNE